MTTVYNGAPYVERGIRCILNQTLQDLEYVIVDDGSTDNTPSLLESISRQDRRVRVLSPGRVGFVNALNLGVGEAQSDFIARQDIDDISYKHRLKLQEAFLNCHPDVGVLGCSYVRVDQNRGEKYVRKPPTKDDKLRLALASYIPFAHTLVMFRKQSWEQVGGYPKTVEGDLALWIAIAERGWRLSALDEVLGEHYVHSDSYFNRTYSRHYRQANVRRMHLSAVRRLRLPIWAYGYYLAKCVYNHLPNTTKRFGRRSIMALTEEDIQTRNNRH